MAASKTQSLATRPKAGPGAAAEPVAQSGEFLFLGEQLPPGGEPVLVRNDFMTFQDRLQSHWIFVLWLPAIGALGQQVEELPNRAEIVSSSKLVSDTRQIVYPRLRNTDNPRAAWELLLSQRIPLGGSTLCELVLCGLDLVEPHSQGVKLRLPAFADVPEDRLQRDAKGSASSDTKKSFPSKRSTIARRTGSEGGEHMVECFCLRPRDFSRLGRIDQQRR